MNHESYLPFHIGVIVLQFFNIQSFQLVNTIHINVQVLHSITTGESEIFLKPPDISNLAFTNTKVPENQTNMDASH